MADNTAPPTGGAAPAAPITTLPNVADRLSVPASALGLETELPDHLRIPAKPDTNDITPPAPTGPAASAPATGPAAPATGPAASAPATGPAAPASAPTGPAPVLEQKVKIGDKEYTTKDLEKLLAERAQQNQTPPAPVPQTPPAPAPTPEQIAEREKVWQDTFVKETGVKFDSTEAELETLLGGGKDAVALFGQKLTEVFSKAVLFARKSIYAELNPQMAAFAQRIEPLFMNHSQVERVATEQAFLMEYPEYAGQHIQTARDVAEALLARYPEHCAALTPQQFRATVNDQADRIIQADYKRWNPNATDTWRDAVKRQQTTPPPTTTTPPVVPATTTAPTPPPAPPAATAPDPWKQAPGANSPASTPAAGAQDWSKSVAKSLQD